MPNQDLIPPKGTRTMSHRSLQRDAIAMVLCSFSGRTGHAPSGPRPGSVPAARRPEPGPVGGRADFLAVLVPAEPRLADHSVRATGAEHDLHRGGQPPHAIAYAPAGAYAGTGGPGGRGRGSRSTAGGWPSRGPRSSSRLAGADIRLLRLDRPADGDVKSHSGLATAVSRRWRVGRQEYGRWSGLAAATFHHGRGPPARVPRLPPQAYASSAPESWSRVAP